MSVSIGVNTSVSDSKSRKAKSLAYLASEFVRLVKSQENETIDVLRAAALLGVEKRRIYDITNALMGANVLQKQGKSNYKWIGGSVYNENDTESAKRQAQLEGLKRQCEELDVVIHEFSQYIENTYYNNPNVVLTTDELVNSCKRVEDVSNQTILAVSAPAGTDVYVLNGEKGKDNEVFFSSHGGEIRTYLLPSTTENEPFANTLATPATPLTPATPMMRVDETNLSTPQGYMNIDSLQFPNLSNDYNMQDLFP